MAPSLRRSSVLAASVACAAALLVTDPVSAASTAISDPAGDARGVSGTSMAQRRTVDVTRVSYTVADRRLVITTRFVDLASTDGNQYVETSVITSNRRFTISSEVGNPIVVVLDRGAPTRCPGGTTTISSARDVVRQSVPVSCLDATTVRLQSSSTLTRDNASVLARDVARTTGTIRLR